MPICYGDRNGPVNRRALSAPDPGRGKGIQSCGGDNGLRDDGVGFDLDEQRRVDQLADLDHGGGRADNGSRLHVYRA